MKNTHYGSSVRTQAVPPIGAAIGFVFGTFLLALSVMLTATGIA